MGGGGGGQPLCWHQTSTQWQQMSAALWDCITSRPQCAAACERHSNVQAGHIPLVRALTCTSRVTRAKVTATPRSCRHPPTLPLQLVRSPLQPAQEHFENECRLMMPLGGDFSDGHFIYSSPQAAGGKTILGRTEEAYNGSFGCGRSARNIAGCDWSHLKRLGFPAKV